MQIISNYKHDDRLRAQLNLLARNTFSLDFEPWYQAGFWDERYVPYSVIEDEHIVANVSTYRVSVVREDKTYSAAMIGTVMTETAYRGRGYARTLMQTVLDDCKQDTDFVYLFANNTVLDFYPKFGFTRVDENQCVVKIKDAAYLQNTAGDQPRRLNIAKPEDYAVLDRLLDTGIPAPKRLLVPTIRALVLFYCQSYYKNSVLYYPKHDLVVFYHDGVLLDYYSGEPVALSEVITLLAPDAEELPLGFTPENTEGLAVYYQKDGDNLFITNPAIVADNIMFPTLSRA